MTEWLFSLLRQTRWLIPQGGGRLLGKGSERMLGSERGCSGWTMVHTSTGNNSKGTGIPKEKNLLLSLSDSIPLGEQCLEKGQQRDENTKTVLSQVHGQAAGTQRTGHSIQSQRGWGAESVLWHLWAVGKSRGRVHTSLLICKRWSMISNLKMVTGVKWDNRHENV